MGRKPSKPKDPTYAAIEAMVAQSGLNATTQEEVVNYSKLIMKAFLERAGILRALKLRFTLI